MAGERYARLKESWEWLSFAASLPAKPFQFSALTAGRLLNSGRYILVGVSLNNISTNAGVLTLYDGQDTNGEISGVVPFAASAGAAQTFGTRGVLMEIGIYLNPSAGSVTGTVYAVPLAHYNNTPPGE